jgi:hypothetical protein
MKLSLALTMVEQLLDTRNMVTSLGSLSNDVAITLYEEIERLKNANKPLPIESAPKDGTVIDIFNINHERIVNVHWNYDNELWDDGDYFYNNATHWLPILKIT